MSYIELDGKKIKFEKKYSSRARNIRISINSSGKITLTIPKPGFFRPKFLLEQSALIFLRSKKKWILKNIGDRKLKGNFNLDNNTRSHYLEYKEEARSLCEKKAKFWSEKMGLKYNRISIKSMKTKWGSCSSKKNLNFNYKILFLSEEKQDYLIVHELSHLKHMNHSKNFWDLVCKTLLDEKFRRFKISN